MLGPGLPIQPSGSRQRGSPSPRPQPKAGAHRGAAAAAAATGGAVAQGGRLGHGEGGQAPGLAVAAVALQLSGPLLAWGQDGLAIG